MNKKQVILLLVLGLVVGGAALIVVKNRQQTYTRSTQNMGSKLLGDFDINTVSAIRITVGSNTLNVARTGEIWTVKERGDYPANFGSLADLLRKLADLKITKPVVAGPSRLPVLELVPPDKQGPGALLELKDTSGKTVKSLLLGAKHMQQSSGGPMGESSYPDGRYVMVDGKTESIALVADALTQVEPKAEDWINKDWFKIEKHKSISVVTTNATNNWKLSRDTEAGEWKLANLSTNEQYDTSKGSSVTSALSWPSFNDVAVNKAPDVTGLDKPLVTATLESFEGFTYTAKVGQKVGSEDNYYFQIAVAGNFPKERTPGKDEKPEDKDKLDKEFKEQLKKKEEKLKTEQAFQKWTYIMSKWTIDPLLKERKDLLVEKKDEAKPEEPKK